MIKQSIIRIESGSIELNRKIVNYHLAEEKEADLEETASSVTITFEKYSQISNLLCLELIDKEEGMKKIDLINFYMESEEELINADDFELEMKILELVIKNLIVVEHIFLIEDEICKIYYLE